ncbi:hypothetical protein HaLaN_11263 [Haematococcus lacustris]|uniref:Uncharacterized protein n=1 Tax=Haematococcus lacustris TaxID=44745 RepID=A0A699Z7B6_HAELA|nr:hypothetical protein HaLaN_11263 [Haematococcus lacustris]
MLKEAVQQIRAGRVVLVDEFRTSRVSSADNTPSETILDTPPESLRWLRPVKSMAKPPQVRGLMCSTSINNITRFNDRDVSAALNIRRCAVGPGPRLTELASCSSSQLQRKTIPSKRKHKTPHKGDVCGFELLGLWYRHTHQKAELKWALNTLSVAFTMMSSQPGRFQLMLYFGVA